MVLIWLLEEISSPAACCPPKLSALIWASCPVELNNQTCNNLTQPRIHPCAGPAAAHSISLFLSSKYTTSGVQVCVQMAKWVRLILLLLDSWISEHAWLKINFSSWFTAWQRNRVCPFPFLKIKQTHKKIQLYDYNNIYAFYILIFFSSQAKYPLATSLWQTINQLLYIKCNNILDLWD